MQYNLNEICLLPSSKPTDITSRKQVYPYNEDGNLPIFVAPMTSIINEENFSKFQEFNVIPILPRNCTETRDKLCKTWHSYSLQEFEEIVHSSKNYNGYKILIDIANGHMKKIYNLVKEAKSKWPNIVIMIGNIAHPGIYSDCCLAGVDYVRCTIGTGSQCSTGVQTGIHASHQWLIEEIKKLSCYYNNPKRTKLIADGGINTIDKAIKCLALGYDYVMMGKCFAQCEEACGETKEVSFTYTNMPKQLVRKYYGMASEQGQIDISGGICKNPEGIETWIPVDTNLKEFTTKFEAALRSSMSYTGAHNLKEFKCTEYDIMSIEEFKSYYK